MKIMKKIVTMLLAVCLIVPCFANAVYAADGRISFGDPTTKAGETFTMNAAVRTTAGNIGDVKIKMAYDSSALSFVSGDGVTKDGDGTLTYSGTGNSGELKFTMTFQALKEGTTSVSVSEYSASMADGSTLTCQQGSSSVTVEAGNGEVVPVAGTASGVAVEVDGQSYTLSGDFAEGDIPLGFVKTEMQFNGQQVAVVEQETSGTKLGYLVDAQNKGAFFLYNNEDATFAPYMEVMISDEASIILLRNEEEVKLPKSYKKVTLTMNEVDFPAWQDPAKEGIYVLYAVNSLGEKSLYQYDDMDKTYQRFFATDDKTEDVKKDTSILGKISDFLTAHMNYVVLGGGLGVLLFLIIVIVLAIKLSHRNRELDDLYDEYGIDEEEEIHEKKPKAKKTKENKFRKRQEEEDYFTTSLKDLNDVDESDDYGYDDDDDYDDESYDDYEDDGYDFDEAYDLPKEKGSKKQSKGYDVYGDDGFDLDDDFEIDFLDLD